MKTNLLVSLSLILAVAGCADPAGTPKKNMPSAGDSCANALRFEMAEATQGFARPGYTGYVNNYVGDDTTRLDFRHRFESGELVGSEFYYLNGQLQEEFPFKCQSLHGTVRVYHPNGQLAQKIPFRYGRKQGQGMRYDSLGAVIETVVFENDSLIRSEK